MDIIAEWGMRIGIIGGVFSLALACFSFGLKIILDVIL